MSEALLEPSPTAPYGVHLSPERVTAAFEEAWALGGVVLVEGSDLARADRFMPVAAPAHRPEVRREALRSTDAIVARLLESVDPSRDSVLVVAPYHSEAAVHLTVAGMRGPGIEPGLLRSGSTRRTGLVTLVDIAPTILDLAGVERPDSMEGRRFEPVTGGPATGIERAEYLTGIDQAARYRDRMVAPVAVTFVVLQAVLWIAAIVAIRRGAPAGRRTVALAALSLLAFLPATYLAGLVDFHASPATAYWVFVVGLAVALAVAATAVGGRTLLDPLLLVLGVVFGLLVVDMLARRAPAAEHRVRLLADGGRAVRRDGEPRLRDVRGRRVPACAGCCRADSTATASVRPWPSACSCWPS